MNGPTSPQLSTPAVAARTPSRPCSTSGPRRVTYGLLRSDYFTRGPDGSVTHAQGVANGLAANGHQVTVVSGPRGDTESAAYAVGVKRLAVGEGANFRSERRWRRELFKRLDGLLAEFDPRDVMLVRYSMRFGWRFARYMRRWPDIAWGFEVNSLLYHHAKRLPKVARRRILRWECGLLAAGRFVYVVSDQLRRDIMTFHQLSPERILVIPNGGPSPLWDQVPAPQNTGGSGSLTRFVYLGRLHTYYDLRGVIDAFHRVALRWPDVELHFFGDGDQYAAIQQYAADHDKIVFHGRYHMATLLAHGEIRQGDCLILPNTSDVTYLSPIKLFEYMALGLPIVAARVGQNAELLADERTAKLYNPNDGGGDDGLAAAMAWVLTHPQEAARMGVALRATYEAEHTWPKRMQQLVSGIESVLSAARGSED